MSHRQQVLPISQRPLPDAPTWLDESSFLLEAGIGSVKTETTYRSGMRLLADWLQHFSKAGYSLEDAWPLAPQRLTTTIILEFRNWMLANRSRSTAATYTAAILSYLTYLDGRDMLPTAVQLGKLQRQITRRKVEQNIASGVIDMDQARADIPRIVAYYEALPLPPENDLYNRRLSLLRNRALVHTLYATAARISEVVSINRSNIQDGRADTGIIVGKGSKPRTIHLREYAQRAIRTYLGERIDSNPALFVSHSRNALNARLSATSAHNIVKKAVKALGLHPGLSAHDFRHFRATQLLRQGAPLEVVQEYLGHADISTTRGIYAPVLGVGIISDWLDNLDVSPTEALTP